MSTSHGFFIDHRAEEERAAKMAKRLKCPGCFQQRRAQLGGYTCVTPGCTGQPTSKTRVDHLIKGAVKAATVPGNR